MPGCTGWRRLCKRTYAVIPGVHHELYNERRLRLTAWRAFIRVVYHEPLFKTRCARVGTSLRLVGGLPLLMGNPIHLTIGVALYTKVRLCKFYRKSLAAAIGRTRKPM